MLYCPPAALDSYGGIGCFFIVYGIMARLRKILDISYRIISASVITIGLILLIIYLCGIRFYRVRSGSMGKLLPVGCVCFVSTYSKYDSVETGDVISFKVDDDMFVTHRAVRITPEGIITKGDENMTEDPDVVTKDNYIGKTVFALPCVGRLFGFFYALSGKITLAVSILALLVMGRFYRGKVKTQN